MPRERLPMRKIHDVLRLHAVGLSKRRIAVGLNIGRTAVGDYLRRARRAGLAWPLPEGLSDEALERLLFAPPPVLSPDRRPLPDWLLLHRELKRPGVTLSLLWEEYRAVHRDGYGYSRFLRSLPGLARPARPDHAPDPCRRRQAVRRLRRRQGGRDRRPHRRGSHGPDLRRHPGRLQLHLCRGDLDAGAARLDRLAQPRLRLFRRGAPTGRTGQSQIRRRQGLPVRSRDQPNLRRHGGPLRHRHHADAAAQTTRQSESGSRRPGRRTLDPGPPAKSAFLQPRGTEPGHRRAVGRSQRAPDKASRRVPPGNCSRRSTNRR